MALRVVKQGVDGEVWAGGGLGDSHVGVEGDGESAVPGGDLAVAAGDADIKIADHAGLADLEDSP